MTYELIRSSRKTAAIQIKNDGTVVVRAPQRMPKRDIDRFVLEHEDWIIAHVEKIRRQQAEADREGHLSLDDINELAEKAAACIPGRVKHYAGLMGLDYGRITIRNQRTRWGSCSAAGNLNFNCLLMLMPEEILDYVVVHELAHRKEMNHSPEFWAAVEAVMPDYRQRRRWLKENGGRYIQMMQ